MSLYLITGLPGTGKSSVYAELKARGHKAYDGDEDHLAHWFDGAGNKVAEANYQATAAFIAQHSRNIDRPALEALQNQAADEPIFVCNDPENEDELQDLFAGVFALVIDEPLRQQRLATRTNNDWGKLPHEVAYDLAIKDVAYERYKKYSYTVIDSNQSVAKIVNSILQAVS